MARRPSVTPAIKLTTTLPEDTHAILTLHLWSDLEGRVPPGAYQRFFVERIREFFSTASLDLAPYIGGVQGDFIVRGSPTAIRLLNKLLKGEL